MTITFRKVKSNFLRKRNLSSRRQAKTLYSWYKLSCSVGQCAMACVGMWHDTASIEVISLKLLPVRVTTILFVAFCGSYNQRHFTKSFHTFTLRDWYHSTWGRTKSYYFLYSASQRPDSRNCYLVCHADSASFHYVDLPSTS